MGLYEGPSKSGREILDDLWILAGAVADKDSEALKDDLSAVLEAMSKPSDMFDDTYNFLEGRGSAVGGARAAGGDSETSEKGYEIETASKKITMLSAEMATSAR